MPASSMPLMAPPSDVRAELDVDVALVQRLVGAQHPDLADLPVRPFAEGWDNALFRIGEDWLARLPRRACAAPLVLHEQRWLPELAPHLPLALPVPLRAGRPGEGYPWGWSICGWLEGGPAAGADLEPTQTARALGGFLSALHGLDAPPDGPQSDVRGVSPGTRSDPLLDRMKRPALRAQVDAPEIERAWKRFTDAPDWRGPPVWCHGDLHPFNLLAHDDRLVAAIDWGDMHVREPAPDLAAPWLLLPLSAHGAFREAYGEIDEATWRRGQAWALYLATMLVDAALNGAGDAALRVGEAAIERLLG